MDTLYCKWIVDRSTDIENIQETLKAAGIANYELYFAATIDMNLNGRDHYQIAAELLKTDDLPYVAVFDRDVQIHHADQFGHVLSILDTLQNWDIVFLDHHRAPQYDEAPSARSLVHERPRWSRAYILSRAGAEKICEYTSLLPSDLVISHDLAVLDLIPDFVSYRLASGLVEPRRDAPAVEPAPVPKNLNHTIEKEAEAEPEPMPEPQSEPMTEPMPEPEAQPDLTERQRIKKQVLEQIPDDVPDATVEQLVDNIMKQRAAKGPAPVPNRSPAPAPAPAPATEESSESDEERENIRAQVLKQVPPGFPAEGVEQLVDNIMKQQRVAPAPEPEDDERAKIRAEVIAQVPDTFPKESIEQIVDNILKKKREQQQSSGQPPGQSEGQPEGQEQREKIRADVLAQVPAGNPADKVEQLVDSIIKTQQQAQQQPQVQQPEVFTRFKLLCINLENRPDRKLEFIQQMHEAQIDSYEFVDGVDGEALTIGPELQKLIENNTFGGQRPVIGKTMAHIAVWNRLCADADADFYVVFEDDAQLTANFKDKITSLLRGLLQIPDWSVVWLGYKHAGPTPTEYQATDTKQLRVHPLNRAERSKGTYGYIVHKRAAAAFVASIKARGIVDAVDDMMVKDGLNLELMPHIVNGRPQSSHREQG